MTCQHDGHERVELCAECIRNITLMARLQEVRQLAAEQQHLPGCRFESLYLCDCNFERQRRIYVARIKELES